MCQYCNYLLGDGWTTLLEYDDVYQSARREERSRRSNHGFAESFEELQADLEPT
ncbi:MAG: hypothetical protein ACQETB_08170 [Halobacteriota archaeon]